MPVVRLKKKVVAGHLTCPLCSNIFNDATTIRECLHTFCKKCIDDKFTKERLRACPICNVDLGGIPNETKLGQDRNWLSIKSKLFPEETESVKAGPETVAVAASLKSSKKKEKSIASLMDSSSSRVSNVVQPPVEPNVVVKEKPREVVLALPRVQSSAKPIITFKKREKKASVPKKNNSGMESEQPQKEAEVKKVQLFDLNTEPDNGSEEAEASRSQECILKDQESEKYHGAVQVLYDLSKSLSAAKEVALLNINDTPVIGDDTEETADPIDNNCVVNRETDEVPVQVSQNTVLSSSDRDTEEVSSQKLKKNNGKVKQECSTSRSRKKKGKKKVEKSYSLRPRKDGRTVTPAASTTPEEENKVEEHIKKVWFTIKASKTHNTDMILPEINGYMRVNGTFTVSYVKKYVMVKVGRKLGIENEDEVEIWLRHEPLDSSQTLQNLVDWWVQTTPLSERKSAMVGGPAGEFVLVLHYSLKPELSGSE